MLDTSYSDLMALAGYVVPEPRRGAQPMLIADERSSEPLDDDEARQLTEYLASCATSAAAASHDDAAGIGAVRPAGRARRWRSDRRRAQRAARRRLLGQQRESSDRGGWPSPAAGARDARSRR